MLSTSSHQTYHRLHRLITTVLAQMRRAPATVEDPVSLKQSSTYDESSASIDSTLTQAAQKTTLEQDAQPRGAILPAPSSVQAGYVDLSIIDSGASVQGPPDQHPGESPAEYSKKSLLRGKKACLVINPRAGHNFTSITAVLAVLSAAGWKTDIAVKQYGGHAVELATRAAEQGYDLVIAYGGDGTINHVVNGLMSANGKGRRKAVGIIPGGTANQWAAEINVPLDPVKAALALIDSHVRTVDLGRVQVQEIKFLNQTQESQQREQKGQKARKRKAKQAPGGENYFLLTAGLGIDAAVINPAPQELKQRVGPFAFDLAVAESLPEQHPFPIEVAIVVDGQDQPVSWIGEAYEVILGNTRHYANAVELTPDAYLDDGKLDLCVITEGNTFTTLQQITSLLFRRRSDEITARHFLGACILITVPASVHMHLDGSPVELEDYLSQSGLEALLQEQDREQVMVTYRFTAVPHALRVAIPHTYDNTLFEHAYPQEESSSEDLQGAEKDTAEQHDMQHVKLQSESPDLVNMLEEQGYKVKITGVATVPHKRYTSIIAGSTVKQPTGQTRPVAVRIDDNTIVLLQTGEPAPLTHLQKLPDGAVFIAHGKKSKRGVIKAKHVVFPG